MIIVRPVQEEETGLHANPDGGLPRVQVRKGGVQPDGAPPIGCTLPKSHVGR
jgi:hypothetical protein